MTTVIADCETNNLLGPKLTRLWMVQIGDADGSDAVLYVDLNYLPAYPVYDDTPLTIRPLAEGLERLRSAEKYVFHNGLGFDLDAVNHFHPGLITPDKMLDTLVMARLAFPEERDHTLRAWGKRMGTLKGEYAGDFQTIDADLLNYSEQDVIVGRALFHKVRHVLEWGESCALEHLVARAMILQERNGFSLNVKAAEALAVILRGDLEAVEAGFASTFPPLERIVDFMPKVNNRTLGYVKGVMSRKRSMEAFNPASRHHCAERLTMAGWKPQEFGKDGTPTLTEKILEDLPYPEAAALVGYFKTSKKLAQLSDGKEGWLRHVTTDGLVHGRVNPNGAVTGRMSHSKPNMANIDKDPAMRGLWGPRSGMVLVGCDAEGLEARMLAHYLTNYDGGAYTKVVLEGNSKDRTDVHSANLKALVKMGVIPRSVWDDPRLFKAGRDRIKNLLYAMMYGAQDPKLGAMMLLLLKAVEVKPTALTVNQRGAQFRAGVMSAMVGLEALTLAVKARAKTRQYLTSLDGRHLPVRSQHAALNTLLQGGGAVVMKKAKTLWLAAAAKRGWVHGVQYGQCADVHDEWQVEVLPDLAPALGAMMEGSIYDAGVLLGLRCPLAGKAGFGKTWAETH